VWRRDLKSNMPSGAGTAAGSLAYIQDRSLGMFPWEVQLQTTYALQCGLQQGRRRLGCSGGGGWQRRVHQARLPARIEKNLNYQLRCCQIAAGLRPCKRCSPHSVSQLNSAGLRSSSTPITSCCPTATAHPGSTESCKPSTKPAKWGIAPKRR